MSTVNLNYLHLLVSYEIEMVEKDVGKCVCFYFNTIFKSVTIWHYWLSVVTLVMDL